MYKFTCEELQMIYIACMAMGNRLEHINTEVSGLGQINEDLFQKAKEYFDLAAKIMED